MTIAREQLAMRNRLQQWLQPEEVRQIHWPTLLNASTAALTRGWTCDELARWILGDLTDPDNVGAVATATIRSLAEQDPPRDVTPSPEPYDDTERHQRIANAATPEQAAHWAEHIRATIAGTPTRGTGR